MRNRMIVVKASSLQWELDSNFVNMSFDLLLKFAC